MSTRASTTTDDLPTDAPELDAPEYVAPEVETDENAPLPLYGEDGSALYENEQGEPCDLDGNVIPARYEETEEGRAATGVATPPAEEPDEAVPAPAAKPVFRSPFAEGIFTERDQERYDALLDPEAQELIDKRLLGMVDRALLAREQQQEIAQNLGVNSEYQNTVVKKMLAVERHLPADIKGTPVGANIALTLAAMQEVGEGGNFVDALKKWTEPSAAVAPVPPATPRQPVPPMAPSQRSMPARPAPDNTRSARAAQKMVGTLTQEQIALIRAERKTVKNGR